MHTKIKKKKKSEIVCRDCKKNLLYLIKNDSEVREALSLNYVPTASCYGTEYRKVDEEKIQALHDEIQALETENRKLSLQLSECENYLKLDTVYKSFCSLESDALKSFKSIVNISTPLSFVLSVADIDNLRLFFEKLCMEWEKYNGETLEILNEVFDFGFEQYCTIHSGYCRINTVAGEDFDLNKHTRTADSLPVGKVTKVIIKGFTNKSGTKKLKSYVEIG